MPIRLNRRTLIKAGAAAFAAPNFFVRNSWAAGKTMQIGIWGGEQGAFIRSTVLPAFEKDFDCKIDAQQGSTLGQIALLRAAKDAPKFTVMFVDDLGVEIAKREGLIDPLPKDKMPNLAKVYPRFIYNDGYGVALAVSSAGLFYNTQTTQPLASYAELWDPKFKGQISLVGTKTTPSVFTVIAAAAVATGKPYKEAQYLADQAWPKLQELKPNILNLYSTDDASLLVSQGQGMIGGPEYSKYVLPYTMKGATVDMCYPEGRRVRRRELPDLGQERARARSRRRFHEPYVGAHRAARPGRGGARRARHQRPDLQTGIRQIPRLSRHQNGPTRLV